MNRMIRLLFPFLIICSSGNCDEYVKKRGDNIIQRLIEFRECYVVLQEKHEQKAIEYLSSACKKCIELATEEKKELWIEMIRNLIDFDEDEFTKFDGIFYLIEAIFDEELYCVNEWDNVLTDLQYSIYHFSMAQMFEEKIKRQIFPI